MKNSHHFMQRPLYAFTIAALAGTSFMSVAAQTDILWDATSNVVALSLSGSGKMGFGDGIPAIPNNAGSGVTGDVLVTNGTSIGTLVIKFRKVSGWDNIT